MSDILARIRAYKHDEVAAARAVRGDDAIEAAADRAPPVRGFGAALLQASVRGYGLIAEIKRASPSAGQIRPDFDPAELARAYAEGGATCLSVLTDTPSFQGAPEHLERARAACALPVLRKDFLFDPWQVAESRAMGADCILIILAMVTDAEAAALARAARGWGMDVLAEVHTEDELDRAAKLDTTLYGINNRNLADFSVDLDITRRLARMAPDNALIVSESGLRTAGDLADLARYGARCFLIGESLMRAEDVTAATRALLADPLRPGQMPG
jgi:indole-3-glycerol phosphate synthase